MALPLLGPLRDLITGHAGKAAEGAAITAVTVLLSVAAAGLLVAAGIVALAAVAGFPLAALVFALVLAVAALGAHLYARRRAARRAAEIAAAENRAAADVVLASAFARSVVPLLSLAAGVATVVMSRRR
ncbi:MAG: hypothetical protein JJU18_06590 [Oceanicaulis sp.]|nr:hypothetical protein [Oceanicaulis sp.]